MSTASMAHETQEPTPIHPVGNPVHVPFENGEGATPAAEWSVDVGATEQPSTPCAHDWHTKDASRDPAMRVVKAECAKCGAKKMLTMDDAHEWRSLNLAPPSKQTLADMIKNMPLTRGSIPFPNATAPPARCDLRDVNDPSHP